MSLFTLIKAVAASKMNTYNAVKPQHSLVPLNLHQGSAVTLPDLDIALAQSDGSILPNVTSKQTIIAVGTMKLFDLNVYHSYLSDGTSFLRTIADRVGNVKEVTLFTNKDEIIPQTQEDWEFWLGSYQKDGAGQFVRDSSGATIIAEYGLIGWNAFSVDGPPQIIYDRAWGASDKGIEPISYTETIVGLDGSRNVVGHEGMEYSRVLGTEPNLITEDLMVSLAQIGNQASVNIYVGIPLNIKDLQVLAAS
jgi:hypothetical protein